MCVQNDNTDVFITSLQKYLHANQFSTGTSQKLWQAVAQETGLPIGDWMRQWTYSGGFPLVSASMKGNKVTLSQVGNVKRRVMVVQTVLHPEDLQQASQDPKTR